jgi:integrase
MEREGIKRLRMQDLRQTFASNYVIKGGNLVSLQKILGHSTITMTLRYAHLTPDLIAREIDLLDFEPSLVRPREEARLWEIICFLRLVLVL